MKRKNGPTKVSCVIPCHNEEPRILGVLNVVRRSKLVDEIIIVDDGSNDKTGEILEKESGITFVRLKKNMGNNKYIVKSILL